MGTTTTSTTKPYSAHGAISSAVGLKSGSKTTISDGKQSRSGVGNTSKIGDTRASAKWNKR